MDIELFKEESSNEPNIDINDLLEETTEAVYTRGSWKCWFSASDYKFLAKAVFRRYVATKSRNTNAR